MKPITIRIEDHSECFAKNQSEAWLIARTLAHSIYPSRCSWEYQGEQFDNEQLSDLPFPDYQEWSGLSVYERGKALDYITEYKTYLNLLALEDTSILDLWIQGEYKLSDITQLQIDAPLGWIVSALPKTHLTEHNIVWIYQNLSAVQLEKQFNEGIKGFGFTFVGKNHAMNIVAAKNDCLSLLKKMIECSQSARNRALLPYSPTLTVSDMLIRIQASYKEK